MKLPLLEQIQIYKSAEVNPEGVSANTVVRIMSALRECETLTEGEGLSIDNLLKSLGLADGQV